LFRTGTSKASELGGLYRTMPWTMVFCVVGAASISAFPLFSGFVSKSLILSASAKEHYALVWAVLVFASAGVLSHSGIKIPYFTFFAHDSGKRPKEAPTHMLVAMGITAFLCIAIGVFPGTLYSLLPFDIEYVPYTTSHVLSQMQLLFFALLAFALLMRFGIYPAEKRGINIDTDWFYRKLAPAAIGLAVQVSSAFWQEATRAMESVSNFAKSNLSTFYGPNGKAAHVQPTGIMVLWIAVLLGAALLVSLLNIS